MNLNVCLRDLGLTQKEVISLLFGTYYDLVLKKVVEKF